MSVVQDRFFVEYCTPKRGISCTFGLDRAGDAGPGPNSAGLTPGKKKSPTVTVGDLNSWVYSTSLDHDQILTGKGQMLEPIG